MLKCMHAFKERVLHFSAFIEVVGHTITPNATCMFQESPSAVPINIDSIWSNIPEFMNTLGVVIGTLGILKFIVAQSPLQMRTLMFGCYYRFSGVFALSGINLYKCFINFPHIPPSCGFYFHLTNTIILIVIFILFIILSNHGNSSRKERDDLYWLERSARFYPVPIRPLHVSPLKPSTTVSRPAHDTCAYCSNVM